MNKPNLGRPGLSLVPLGVGDAFSAIHHPTCLLVSRYENPAWDDDLVLIDCPQGVRKMMREADDGRYHGLDLHRVGTLVLTHLHADHASGIETIAAFFKIALGRKLRLVALPEVLDGVPRFLEAISSLGGIDDFFDVVPVRPGDRVELFPAADGFNDGMVLASYRTRHPIPTSALRLWYRGRQLAYSCDTSFDHDLWRWLWEGPRPQHSSPADLVVHEVGHGIHTSFDDILKATQGTGPWHRLRLVHYPDDLLPLLEAHHRGIALLREGELEIV